MTGERPPRDEVHLQRADHALQIPALDPTGRIGVDASEHPMQEVFAAARSHALEPAPKIGTQIRTDFIQGMGKRDAQFIMILDIDRVFSAEELSAIHGESGKPVEAVV